jgi:hypothetical protein
MVKWDYLVVQIGSFTNDAGGKVKWVRPGPGPYEKLEKNRIDLFEALNILGTDGWELVGIEKRGKSSWDPLYILKRPQNQ